MIRISIDMIPPSWNVFAGRQNSREYREAKAQWTNWIYLLCTGKRPRAPYKRAHVRILYRFPDRIRRDPDNYSGKFILDGLTRARIIEDDSFRCIRLSIEAEPEPGKARTIIEVEECE